MRIHPTERTSARLEKGNANKIFSKYIKALKIWSIQEFRTEYRKNKGIFHVDYGIFIFADMNKLSQGR